MVTEKDLADLMSKKEASDFLRCSLATINRLMMRQKINYYKPGGKVLFRKGDLVKYLEAHKVRNT